MRDIIINASITRFVNTVDREMKAGMLTNGEMVVVFTLLLSGILKDAGSKDVLTVALGLILHHQNDNEEEERQYYNKLIDMCRINEDPR